MSDAVKTLMHKWRACDEGQRWRLFGRELARFTKCVQVCRKAVCVTPTGHIQYTPKSVAMMKALGCVYAQFFHAVEEDMCHCLTPEQRAVVTDAARRARALM